MGWFKLNDALQDSFSDDTLLSSEVNKNEPVMQRPFLIHKNEYSDLILSADELTATWESGRIDPGVTVIDQRTGSQFPACMLSDKPVANHTVFGRVPEKVSTEDDNSGLY
jgi:hypothetical protein